MISGPQDPKNKALQNLHRTKSLPTTSTSLPPLPPIENSALPLALSNAVPSVTKKDDATRQAELNHILARKEAKKEQEMKRSLADKLQGSNPKTIYSRLIQPAPRPASLPPVIIPSLNLNKIAQDDADEPDLDAKESTTAPDTTTRKKIISFQEKLSIALNNMQADLMINNFIGDNTSTASIHANLVNLNRRGDEKFVKSPKPLIDPHCDEVTLAPPPSPEPRQKAVVALSSAGEGNMFESPQSSRARLTVRARISSTPRLKMYGTD